MFLKIKRPGFRNVVTASSSTRKAIEDLLQSFESVQRTSADVRQLNRFINTVTELVGGPASSLDIKIASSAVEEMSRAFTMFAPYRDVRKVSIFGSARTTPDSPIYALTAATARPWLIINSWWLLVLARESWKPAWWEQEERTQ